MATLSEAVEGDDVAGTEMAMRHATDSFAPMGQPHERACWDGPRGVGCGIRHDETPFYTEWYGGFGLHGADANFGDLSSSDYQGNLQGENDDGRHLGQWRTL